MKITTCPICTSRKIKVITGAITFQTASGAVTIPHVTREKCENCGEEFFDHEANLILDQFRGVTKAPRRDKTTRDKRHALQQ